MEKKNPKESFVGTDIDKLLNITIKPAETVQKFPPKRVLSTPKPVIKPEATSTPAQAQAQATNTPKQAQATNTPKQTPVTNTPKQTPATITPKQTPVTNTPKQIQVKPPTIPKTTQKKQSSFLSRLLRKKPAVSKKFPSEIFTQPEQPRTVDQTPDSHKPLITVKDILESSPQSPAPPSAPIQKTKPKTKQAPVTKPLKSTSKPAQAEKPSILTPEPKKTSSSKSTVTTLKVSTSKTSVKSEKTTTQDTKATQAKKTPKKAIIKTETTTKTAAKAKTTAPSKPVTKAKPAAASKPAPTAKAATTKKASTAPSKPAAIAKSTTKAKPAATKKATTAASKPAVATKPTAPPKPTTIPTTKPATKAKPAATKKATTAASKPTPEPKAAPTPKPATIPTTKPATSAKPAATKKTTTAASKPAVVTKPAAKAKAAPVPKPTPTPKPTAPPKPTTIPTTKPTPKTIFPEKKPNTPPAESPVSLQTTPVPEFFQKKDIDPSQAFPSIHDVKALAPFDATHYLSPSQQLASLLLNTVIICHDVHNYWGGRIVETEAYNQEDPASHSFKGRNFKNSAMFEVGGVAYVYKIHATNYCLNVVCERENYGSGVLIRAIEPLYGLDILEKNKLLRAKNTRISKKKNSTVKHTELCNGPGKLCLACGIDFRNNYLPFDPTIPNDLLTPRTAGEPEKTQSRKNVRRIFSRRNNIDTNDYLEQVFQDSVNQTPSTAGRFSIMSLPSQHHIDTYASSKRIGFNDKAKENLRFFIPDSPFVSASTKALVIHTMAHS